MNWFFEGDGWWTQAAGCLFGGLLFLAVLVILPLIVLKWVVGTDDRP